MPRPRSDSCRVQSSGPPPERRALPSPRPDSSGFSSLEKPARNKAGECIAGLVRAFDGRHRLLVQGHASKQAGEVPAGRCWSWLPGASTRSATTSVLTGGDGLAGRGLALGRGAVQHGVQVIQRVSWQGTCKRRTKAGMAGMQPQHALAGIAAAGSRAGFLGCCCSHHPRTAGQLGRRALGRGIQRAKVGGRDAAGLRGGPPAARPAAPTARSAAATRRQRVQLAKRQARHRRLSRLRTRAARCLIGCHCHCRQVRPLVSRQQPCQRQLGHAGVPVQHLWGSRAHGEG